MAKLYATLETSKGKIVDVSDNHEIVATLYDGNKKAYSVTIEWCVVGDPEHWQCLECGTEIDNNDKCDECGNRDQRLIELIPAVMGAVVTSQEWRNKPDEQRRKKGNGIQCPRCRADVWDGPKGHKLAKCHGCGLAFDTMTDED